MKGRFGIISGLFAGGSGYRRLTERFGVTSEAPPAALTHQTVMMNNTVIYKYCVVLGPIPEGLYLRVDSRVFRDQPAALIPWSEVVATEPARLYWGRATRLTIGEPKIATLTLSAGVDELLVPYLEAREISQQ